MIKAICMDLDGTLLNSEKTISEKTVTGLRAFADKGVKLILASGRTYKRMAEYAQMINADKSGGKIIEANGVGIYDYEKNTYELIRRMNIAEAKEAIEYLRDKQVEILIMAEENVFVILAPNETTSRYLVRNSNMEGLRNRQFFEVESIDEVSEPINKICVFDDVDIISDIYEDMSRHSFKEDLWFGRPLTSWLEIGPASVSKGNALKKVMKQEGFNEDEVVVFGDGENDLSMLGVVKNSVAMGNAMQNVKDACAYECGTCDEDGIINFLIEKEEIL